MNRNEELDALSRLAVDDSLPVFDANLTCECGDTVSNMSGLSFHVAQLNTASIALNAGWHFDNGKALCKKCWEAKEAKA